MYIVRSYEYDSNTYGSEIKKVKMAKFALKLAMKVQKKE
jgi:hypothetical protein